MERQPLKQFKPLEERAEAAQEDFDLPDPPPPANAPVPLVAALKMPMTAPAAVPVFRGARSGRLIWTGWLGRREVVEIEGSKPSVGSLSGGALPGRSARIH